MAAEDNTDDPEGDPYPTLTKASQVNIEEQEAKIKARRAAKLPKLRMLMEYRHIDTKILKETVTDEQGGNEEAGVVDDMAVAVDDDVFLDVLKESECNVGFLLTKSTS